MAAWSRLKQYIHNLTHLNSLRRDIEEANKLLNKLSQENATLRTRLDEQKRAACEQERRLVLKLQQAQDDFNVRLQDQYQLLVSQRENRLQDQYQLLVSQRENRLQEQYQYQSKEREDRLSAIYQQLNQEYHDAILQMYALAQDRDTEVLVELTNRLSAMESQWNDNLRNEIKKLKRSMGLPAKVVFLCEEASLWKSFETVVAAMRDESGIDVVLVNLWCRQYAEDHSYVYKSSDFSEVAARMGLSFIESYDPDTEKWLDLEQLQPDYVFYMRPYDYYRHESFHISTVSRYAKTCYIPYGMQVFGGEVEITASNKEFCQYLYYYFLDTPCRKEHLRDFLGNPPNLDDQHLLCLGYPRIDLLRNVSEQKELQSGRNFTMLWLPRWNTSENCCTFFEYKDVLANYALNNPDTMLILRPHPLCFNNFLQTGEMTKDELESLRAMYECERSLYLDEQGDYARSFEKADVLVADETSLIAEFYTTGKPIVLCKKQTHFAHLMKILLPGIYVVENQLELEDILNSLRRGIDPLKQTRLKLIHDVLFQGDELAGDRITNQILKDHLQADL